MPDCALTYAAVSLSWQASASDISRTARCSLKTNATTQSVNRISVAAMLRLHRTVGRTPSSALNHRLRSPTMRWTRGSSSEAVSLLPLRIVTPLEVVHACSGSPDPLSPAPVLYNNKVGTEAALQMAVERLARVRAEIAKIIVGQDDVVEGVLICLLASGHVLLEGVPGLGKTTLLRTLARALQLKY